MLKNIAESIKAQVSDQVLNQEVMTELALAAFFASGHILLAGPTGIGKNLWARSFAGALGVSYASERFGEHVSTGFFSNITPDPENENAVSQLRYITQPGSFFSNVFLANEFDKSQQWEHTHFYSAIDRRVPVLSDIGGSGSFPLPEPHFIIAACEEAANLPKPLADRFMMKLYVNYPGVAAEKQILQMHHVGATPETEPMQVCTPEIIAQAKEEVRAVAVEDAIFNYIVSIAETTRRVSAIQTGVSPRASISLLHAAKAYAAIKGRDYVIIDDVRNLAIPVLRHRITLIPNAAKEGLHAERIIESIVVGKRIS